MVFINYGEDISSLIEQRLETSRMILLEGKEKVTARKFRHYKENTVVISADDGFIALKMPRYSILLNRIRKDPALQSARMYESNRYVRIGFHPKIIDWWEIGPGRTLCERDGHLPDKKRMAGKIFHAPGAAKISLEVLDNDGDAICLFQLSALPVMIGGTPYSLSVMMDKDTRYRLRVPADSEPAPLIALLDHVPESYRY